MRHRILAAALLCGLALLFPAAASAQVAGKTFYVGVVDTSSGVFGGIATFDAFLTWSFSALDGGGGSGYYFEQFDDTTGASAVTAYGSGDDYTCAWTGQATLSVVMETLPVTLLIGFGSGSDGDYFLFVAGALEEPISIPTLPTF